MPTSLCVERTNSSGTTNENQAVSVIACLTDEAACNSLNNMSETLIVEAIEFMGGATRFLQTYRQINTTGAFEYIINLSNHPVTSTFYSQHIVAIIEWCVNSRGEHEQKSAVACITAKLEHEGFCHTFDDVAKGLFGFESKDIDSGTIDAQRYIVALVIEALCDTYYMMNDYPN